MGRPGLSLATATEDGLTIASLFLFCCCLVSEWIRLAGALARPASCSGQHLSDLCFRPCLGWGGVSGRDTLSPLMCVFWGGRAGAEREEEEDVGCLGPGSSGGDGEDSVWGPCCARNNWWGSSHFLRQVSTLRMWSDMNRRDRRAVGSAFSADSLLLVNIARALKKRTKIKMKFSKDNWSFSPSNFLFYHSSLVCYKANFFIRYS